MNTAGLALRKVCASRLNYRLSFGFDLFTPITLLYIGGARHSAGVPAADWSVAAFSFCAGAFLFTFIEYGMHRWLFHAHASFATASHQHHHRSPRAPTSMPFPCSALGGFVLWALFSPMVGEQIAYFVASGILSGYFNYAVLHHLQHHVRIKAVHWQWLQNRWTAHALHHGRLDKNYGVTTSLWDHVFGTYHASRALRARRQTVP